ATTRLARAEALRGGQPANDNVGLSESGTLGGFPNPPAMVRGEQSSPAPHAISGVTRWTSDRLAAEIAALYHQQAARVFTVMDDNLLPLAADDAHAFLRRLAHELRQNRVGPIALSLQLRADVVTPAVADALVAVGLVRAYVGVDG